VGAQFFHAVSETDRQTEMTKLIVAFRNISDSPKYLMPKYCLFCRYDVCFDTMYCVEQQIKSCIKERNYILLIILVCHMFIIKIVKCFSVLIVL